MTEEQLDPKLLEFVSLVEKNLEKNGFPANTVTFPLEKMYASASQRGFSFNKVRDLLQQKGVVSEITGERILFSQHLDSEADLEMFDMQSVMQQILQKMTPEQQAEVASMMQNVPSENIEQMKQQWDLMSATEKADRLKDLQKFTPES